MDARVVYHPLAHTESLQCITFPLQECEVISRKICSIDFYLLKIFPYLGKIFQCSSCEKGFDEICHQNFSEFAHLSYLVELNEMIHVHIIT